MIRRFITLLPVLCALNGFAQNEEDVLRYSHGSVLGTARSQAMGGAFGALGADFSSTQINPAGLGMYRRNELHLSAAVTADFAKTSYISTTMNDKRTSFNIPSLGIVLTKVLNEMGKDVENGLSSVSLGAGITRVNNFQQNMTFSGDNTQSSVLDYFVEQANGHYPSEFYFSSNAPAALAWNTELLNTASASDSSHYVSWVSNDNSYKLRQGAQITTSGAMYEYNLSAAVNVSNWFYLGAGLVITEVYRQSTNIFTEQVLDNSVDTYRGITFTQEVNTHGSGVSGRFGIILRPVDFLKFGLSAQTASRLNLEDDYTNGIIANYTTVPNNERVQGSNDIFSYKIITPAKFTASGAITTNYGLLSLDVEMIDYSSAYIKSDFVNYNTDVNTAVTNSYRSVYNIRLGAEAKISEVFRIRGGFAQFGSPYRANTDLTHYSVSGGVGVINDAFFYDFTIVDAFGKNYYSPFILADPAKTYYTAANNYNNLNFVFTAGYRF